jgi:hypothetical protein
MRNQLTFSTFDPIFSDAPSICGLCGARPSVLHYENGCDEGDSGCRPVRGFCCMVCAVHLLEELELAEAQTWAEEEASVRKEGGDVSDFHARRLATFDSCDRG